LKTFKNQAESARRVRTVGELIAGKPPKRNISEMLVADIVCQATAGPESVDEFEELLMSCHGGEEGSKEDDKER
jgi:Trp operon repressor